ncbi:MAG: hypothetical protein R3F11_27735 [Verrucomicrobiales bacterium]
MVAAPPNFENNGDERRPTAIRDRHAWLSLLRLPITTNDMHPAHRRSPASRCRRSPDWAIDTAQVTGALSVEIRDASDAVVHTSTDASGSAPLVLDESGGALASVAYTLRAIETGGSNMTREATAAVSLDPGIPAADRQSGLQAVESDPLAITLTGSDPNNYPNPRMRSSIRRYATDRGGPDLTYTAEGDTSESPTNSRFG